MKAKDKIREIIDNIKGEKNSQRIKTTENLKENIQKTKMSRSELIDKLLNEPDYGKRVALIHDQLEGNIASQMAFGEAVEKMREHLHAEQGQTREEFEKGLRESAVKLFDSQVDELSKMNDNERVSYYNKHNISLINRAFYEEYVEKKIAEAGDVNPEEQAEAEAIKQKEQKAKDDQDYFDIIECGQNPPGPNYITAEEAIAMDKADEGMGTE